MRALLLFAAAFWVSAGAVHADEVSVARPTLLLKEVVEGMPKGDAQEIKVFTAVIQPGGRTVFHSHRFPVTIYILEGSFTLDMEGRPSVTVSAGQTMVEPPGVKMTGYNKSATEPMRVVVFYVSDPGAPFLDPVH